MRKQNPKAPNMTMMMMLMMVLMMMMMVRVFLVDATLNGSKLLHVAGNGDRTVVTESELFLGFFEQLHEERVVYVHNRNHKLFLFLCFRSHDNRHTPLRNALQIFALMLMMMKLEAHHVAQKMVVIIVFSSANSHF